jgi:hypothetical protein
MIGIDNLQIPKSDQQQDHKAHDEVGDYGKSRLRKAILTLKNRHANSTPRLSGTYWAA